MQYQVTRNGQMYGPYTLEDLQRYVATGHVLLTDLAKSEDMPNWLPVSQVLGAPAAFTAPSAYPQASANPYPDPPNLHWGLVLLFAVLTCGLFAVVWDFVQVWWLRKVEPNAKAMMYFIIYAILWVCNLGDSFGNIGVVMHGVARHTSPLAALISLAGLVFLIVFRFSMRDSLERHFNGPEPVGLRLGGAMTFFFGGLYFQYHFNRINGIKENLRYQNAIR